MEKYEGSRFILSRLELDGVERIVQGAYHKKGSVGRPPRKPIGVFKALIIKRVQQAPSDREMCRRLWNDPEMRMICDIEAEQKPFHPSHLTRFRNRIGTHPLTIDSVAANGSTLSLTIWNCTTPRSQLDRNTDFYHVLEFALSATYSRND